MIIEVKGHALSVNAEKLRTPDTGARATPDIADFSALEQSFKSGSGLSGIPGILGSRDLRLMKIRGETRVQS